VRGTAPESGTPALHYAAGMPALPAPLIDVPPSHRLRLVALVVLLAAGAAAVLVWHPQRLLSGAGPWQTLMFAPLYGVCAAAFVPRPLLNVAAGVLLGALGGTIAALAGTVLAAAIAFGLGRLLGQDALRPLLRGRLLTAADRQLSEHGLRSMLALRLLPGVPFAATNYAAAVSRMGWTPFLLATAVGSVPNTMAYVVAGSRATAPGSPAFLVSVAVITLPALAAVPAARRRLRRRAAV
jgi:uncharacterized membrane protein YdjX (TVP38/TMEM64 family)